MTRSAAALRGRRSDNTRWCRWHDTRWRMLSYVEATTCEKNMRAYLRAEKSLPLFRFLASESPEMKAFHVKQYKRSIRVEAGVAAWTGKWHSYALKNTIVIKIGAKFLVFVITCILKVKFYRFLETATSPFCCIPCELFTMCVYSNEKLLLILKVNISAN